jgi:hypothetical protein
MQVFALIAICIQSHTFSATDVDAAVLVFKDAKTCIEYIDHVKDKMSSQCTQSYVKCEEEEIK